MANSLTRLLPHCRREFGYPAILWLSSTIAVVSSIRFISPELAKVSANAPPLSHRGTVSLMCMWDGDWYMSTISSGYTYDRTHHSSIVFFPGYPFVAGLMAAAGRLPVDVSLVVASNAFFLAALIAFQRYLRLRGVPEKKRGWSILAMTWVPCGFFFHMAYAESMLLFLSILAMYGMRARWPNGRIAIIVGAATGTRAVGIALLVPLILHACQGRSGEEGQDRLRSQPRGAGVTPANWHRKLFALSGWAVLGSWGLLLFCAYQYWRYGEPLAFVKAQMAWHVRETTPGGWKYVERVLTGEPVWSTYMKGAECYWARGVDGADPILSLQFMNPIFFAGAATLVCIGAACRWLDLGEIVLSTAMLMIPYCLQTSRQCMTSEGRFAIVAFPVYMVLGRLLCRVPQAVAIYIIACGAALMLMYTALFCCGYEFL